MQSTTNLLKQEVLKPLKFGLLVAALIFISFQLYTILWHPWDVDFGQFKKAIETLLSGGRLYKYDGQGKGFYYPYPFWTSFLYLPVAWLDYDTALHTWATLNILVLLLAVYLLKRLYLPELSPVYIVPLYCLSLNTASLGILDGFPTILILLGLCLLLLTFQQNRFFLSGCCGSLALLIKPHLTIAVGLVFGFWLLYGRSNSRKHLLRWWVGFLAIACSLVVISLACDPTWVPRFLNTIREVDNMTGSSVSTIRYEWLTATFPSWLNYLTGIEGLALNLIYGLFALIMTAWALYLLIRYQNSPLIWLAITICLNFLLTPYARPYDYPLLVIPIFWLLNRLNFNWQQGNYKLVVAYILVLLLYFALPALNNDYRWFYFQPLLLTATVLLTAQLQPNTK